MGILVEKHYEQYAESLEKVFDEHYSEFAAEKLAIIVNSQYKTEWLVKLDPDVLKDVSKAVSQITLNTKGNEKLT